LTGQQEIEGMCKRLRQRECSHQKTNWTMLKSTAVCKFFRSVLFFERRPITEERDLDLTTAVTRRTAGGRSPPPRTWRMLTDMLRRWVRDYTTYFCWIEYSPLLKVQSELRRTNNRDRREGGRRLEGYCLLNSQMKRAGVQKAR
jgi:hypothetical protein